MRLATLILCTVVLFSSLPLFAQGDTIMPSPKAVEMRRVWKMRGGPDASFGGGIGSVGDINNDGIGDIAINSYIPWGWGVYLGDTGAPATTPVWRFDTSEYMPRPLVGDFWGTGRKAVGFARYEDRDYTYSWLHIFRTEDNWLPDTPAVVWSSVAPTTPRVVPFGRQYMAADLDADGDDELIVSLYGARRGDSTDLYGEIWIYAGGEDFQVERPTAILRDPQLNSRRFSAQVADLDGDHVFDILTYGEYNENSVSVARSYLYFGRPGTVIRNGAPPDRVLEVGGTVLIDCDGDGITDIVNGEIAIFRTGTGKSARTRPFDAADADTRFQSVSIAGLGYLNSKRYAVLGGRGGFQLRAFSGGPEGPDHLWDGWTYGGSDLVSSPFGNTEPIQDCTGDGWDDVMVSTTQYPASNSSDGIVLIFAGGPYIPGEDPTVRVRYAALEGQPNAVSIWPNPAREQVNVAWRGDLTRMPRQFEVHDILGRLVARGEVSDGDGSALWQCRSAAPGAYLLSVFDAQGERLASVRLLKI